MYLWRRPANRRWLIAHEAQLRSAVGHGLAIIERPNRRRLQLEVACASRYKTRKLIKEFGGRFEKLGRNWLKRLLRETNTKPLKIGRRLMVMRSAMERKAEDFRYRLVLPAGAGFGTGEHATTAMSLRFLEEVTRKWRPGWSMVDLGTGSGILALAAKRFGAERVTAIDVDPIAISTAKQNARRNQIGNVRFQVADARQWRFPRRVDLVAANLFSELLIEVLPRLKRSRYLILSGVLRGQEPALLRALKRSKITILETRRRGKWSAVVAAA
jgi:ribosomal protein L11 methyltransferase